jgi:hypothetical protein
MVEDLIRPCKQLPKCALVETENNGQVRDFIYSKNKYSYIVANIGGV